MKARSLTSPDNPRLKWVRKLQGRRERRESGLFVAEGPHVVEVALGAGARVREVFCTSSFLEEQVALAKRLEASAWPVWLVADELLGRLAATEHPQGVVAVAEQPPDAVEPRVEPGLLALALEGVADPGNVGNSIRAAHAAGATMVILGAGCCDRFNAKAVRASAGGLFAVPAMATEDLAGVLGRLRAGGARIVGAEPHGKEGLGVGGRGLGGRQQSGEDGPIPDAQCQIPDGKPRGQEAKGEAAEEEAGGDSGAAEEGSFASRAPRPAPQSVHEEGVLRLCWEVDLTGPTVLVVGSEARGLSEAVRDVATERAGIPMPGGAESLNAGAAAAVLLYEAVRQRRTRPA